MPEIEITPEIRSIRKAINQINRGLLGPFTCLMVAMAAKDMLRRRGITSTLVLGASTNSDKDGSGMTAHAWLCVGATILLGEEERAKFNAVAYYRD